MKRVWFRVWGFGAEGLRSSRGFSLQESRGR